MKFGPAEKFGHIGCLLSVYYDEIRKQRQRAVQYLYKLSILQMGAAIVSIVLGILTIYFASPNPHFPFVFGGPIISGLPVLIATIVVVVFSRTSKTEEEVSLKTKFIIILHYVISVICITFSFLSAAFSGWSLSLCVSDAVTRKGVPVKEFCLPNKNENIIMASIGIAAGVILCVCCCLGTCILCIFGRSFGFKSRYERKMHVQIRMVASQGQTQIPNQNC